MRVEQNIKRQRAKIKDHKLPAIDFPLGSFLPFAFCLLIFDFLILTGPLSAAEEWERVIRPRVWSFPRDFGAHPEYRTEWWYFTGNLSDTAGKRHGYQLTFFRQGLRRELPGTANSWDIRDLYLAHFAITDVARNSFRALERVSRKGPGLAGTSPEGMDVWLLNWSARMKDSRISLEARDSAMELSLRLTPRKPPVVHGENGLSQKGPSRGQASYYVSLTDLKTQGTLKSNSGTAVEVQGTSWFDQEFGSNQLSPDQRGWDWFSLHLSDGRDLMIYVLRLKDGSIEPASSGTLVSRDGTSRHLKLPEIAVSVLDRWKSPRTKAEYPSRWRILVPSAGIDLTVTPLISDQELTTEGSTGVTYWEGAVTGRGSAGGRAVSCEGYIELTGYAGSVGGLF
jgi:predicted secreted hydrolase